MYLRKATIMVLGKEDLGEKSNKYYCTCIWS